MDESFRSQDPNAGHPGIRKAFSTLLAGVASVVPVLATVWLLVLVYKILGDLGNSIIAGVFRFLNWLRGVHPEAPGAWSFEFPGSNLVLALLPVLILFAVGFAVTNALGRHLLHWIESKIQKLPLLGFVYSSIKQLVDALKSLGSERKFKGVAYVEYPSPGCRLLGFVTGNFHDEQMGKDVTAVFLPTAPNPLTGFVVIVEDERVHNSNMSLEEASKLILSAGLVSPAVEKTAAEKQPKKEPEPATAP
ncbi:hypothetical protein HAHE_33710 [Haloferula helveola]|uniref:DUF502 domain-containing protein n=2 Tax=Haloferula helveola TaxID=490095 RepID=A0ABM7RNK0_9BACT|nr:hypothetical protein HAHE_33710 [Haloferula helveola]